MNFVKSVYYSLTNNYQNINEINNNNIQEYEPKDDEINEDELNKYN